ncbi:MAG: ATP-binding cassette domain-containing protein [Gammaproteobacteria bacterium]|nr:ATP-binding cassette domain-containing protein [Gammaproteobacteria bacterium]
MAIVTLKNIYHSFGDLPVLDHANLSIESNERLCLIGRNGAGKSTLMKLISGFNKPDEGELNIQKGIQVKQLIQEVPNDLEGTTYDIVAQGLGSLGDIITEWHKIISSGATDEQSMNKMAELQHEIDAQNGWTLEQQVSSTLSMLDLDGDALFSGLSGGRKRRVLLAQALVSKPDLLLLDEPTNHMDIESILWLENFLKSYQGSLFFITHDRSFLQNIATAIIDLDRGELTRWNGTYEQYLLGKSQKLAAQETENKLFDKKLAQEEVWVRQGIKARRTRNEGRVRALKAMRDERAKRREVGKKAQISSQSVETSGKIVIEAKSISYDWGTKPIVSDYSCKIMRGDKIGIIGPNGCGKSTLIQLLLGEIEAKQGSVKQGTKLDVAYFDQHRSSLDPNKSVKENLGAGSDMIEINGINKHVVGYLKEFLFSDKQINTPVSTLSGGERNRLMLAKIFTKSFNFLIMDEPTNDLDMDTLELLEELLSEFKGTLLLVSHDRAFIDNIVTSTIVFENNGQVNNYIGGYEDWLWQRDEEIPNAVEKSVAMPTAKQKQPKKLSYNDQKELKNLPQKIEKLEAKINDLQNKMGVADFYQQDQETIQQTQAELKGLQLLLDEGYARWEALEEE